MKLIQMVYNAIKSYEIGPGLTFQRGPFKSKDTPKKLSPKFGGGVGSSTERGDSNNLEVMDPVKLHDVAGDSEIFKPYNPTLKRPGKKTKGGEDQTSHGKVQDMEQASEKSSILERVGKAVVIAAGVGGLIYGGKKYYESGGGGSFEIGGRSKNLFEPSLFEHLKRRPDEMDFTTPHQEEMVNQASNVMDYENVVQLNTVVKSPSGGASKEDNMRAEQEFKAFHEYRNKSLLDQTLDVVSSLASGGELLGGPVALASKAVNRVAKSLRKKPNPYTTPPITKRKRKGREARIGGTKKRRNSDDMEEEL